jgi:rod shape-determining protein MreC
LTERRNGWLLIALLVGQLLLLSAQLPDPSGNNRLQALVLRVVAIPGRLIAVVSGAASGVEARFETLASVRTENRALKEENQRLKEEVIALRDAEAQVRQLSQAVRYTPPPGGELVLADILYLDHASWVRTLVIYAADTAPEHNAPVMTSEGLVGRVIVVSGPLAKVQLITDRAASVGAMIERSRHQGVVRGTGRGDLELAFLPRQSDVRVGDRVITSGVDGVFPRGIPIGTVAEVQLGDDLFYEIRLAPAADLRRLDHVYVQLRPLELDPIREETPGAR